MFLSAAEPLQARAIRHLLLDAKLVHVSEGLELKGDLLRKLKKENNSEETEKIN